MTTLFVHPLFLGTTELLLIGGIALLLFGGKKLPEMMRGLGQGVKEFKKGMNDPAAEPAGDDPADNREDGQADRPDSARPGGAARPADKPAEDGQRKA